MICFSYESSISNLHPHLMKNPLTMWFHSTVYIPCCQMFLHLNYCQLQLQIRRSHSFAAVIRYRMSSCNQFSLKRPAVVIDGSAAEIVTGRGTAAAILGSKTSESAILAN